MSYFDALTLAAVVDELRAAVVGGRIQRVLLPSQLSVALEIYADHRRHHLILSAHPRFARVHLSGARPSRGLAGETPLLLLLRKYVNGGRVVAVEQPNLERVVLLSIAKRPPQRNSAGEEPDPADWDDDGEGDEGVLRCELVAEVMDQRSNIVLVSDENIIMAAARRVTSQMSRRVVLPGEPYELPPPQEKRDPRAITAAGARDAAEAAAPDQKGRPPTLARVLVGAYRGLSPLAAREAAFRATGDAEALPGPDTPWERVAESVRALWSGQWAPSLAERGGEPEAFAPYALTSAPAARPAPSTSAAVEAFYAARERLTDHQQRRDALRSQVGEARERLERQRAALAGELEQGKDMDRLRWEGEMIFAFLHAIAPRQEELRVEGDERVIRLSPDRTAVENAQERFRAYEKARAAVEGVPERLRATELRIAGLDETLAMLEVAEGYEAIEAIAQELAEQGTLGTRQQDRRRRGAGKVRAAPLRLESSDGLVIYVGRSAGQNEMVTFKLGAPEDLWLHARNMPGAHVIIKSAGRQVPERTLEEAAGLAAYYTRAREEAAVEVDFARRIQVRRIRGGPPGLVSYHAEGTVRAAPRPPWR